MTRNEQAHLSEEAMDDLLIGLGSAESRAHLALCAECGSRVKEFHAGVEAFNQASLAWSEARPYARRQAAPRQAVPPWSAHWGGVWQWSGALAAMLLLAIGISIWSHHPSSQNQAALPTPAQADSEAQIAQDNDLLRSVNVALQEGEEPPVNAYNLMEAPHPRLRARPELRKQ